MRAAYFRVMALDAWRDKGALAMAFFLPGVVFVIFASIFSAAAGGDITVRAVVLDQRHSEDSQRLLARLAARGSVELQQVTGLSRDELIARVRDGRADVALLVRANGTGFSALSSEERAPLEVIYDPLRGIAATLAVGALQSAWVEALPGARIRMVATLIDENFAPFSDPQREALEAGLAALDAAPELAELPSGALLQMHSTAADGEPPASVTYYAGAVAMLFLLLASLNGALSLLDEKRSGLFDRLSMGPGGVGAMIDGRFAYLTLQGSLQVGVIYLVAWVLFGVDLPGHWPAWAAVTVAAAASTAGLALFFVSCCGTRQQAQTLGNISVLLLSAIGGSMVPRFMMPPELQSLGWMTPNTWALEAYEGVFRRGGGLASSALPMVLLLGSAALTLLGARLVVGLTGRR